jgi:hypothetical protein
MDSALLDALVIPGIPPLGLPDVLLANLTAT